MKVAMTRRLALLGFVALCACGRTDHLGRAPSFTDLEDTTEHLALYSNPMPLVADPDTPTEAASLWTSSPASLFGDRRAGQRGDILTVVIEIDDSAQISNSSDRERKGNEKASIKGLFGLPQSLDEGLPDEAAMADAVNIAGSSSYAGEGSVERNEQLTLRIAATVVEELPNGVLRIEGQQEVRVNYELRELLIDGYVRPQDITRQNEISYDKIAGARISYGGRGQISDVQQPRYGQQVADIILPF
jgi:flagellar L-ring protein precursor FlgH